METREIIKQAKAGTLEVPEEVQVDPYHGFNVGDRVAYCSVKFDKHAPVFKGMTEEEAFQSWLSKFAKQGTIVGLVVSPAPPVDGPLTHKQYWATTATVEWDNENTQDYIKAAHLLLIKRVS